MRVSALCVLAALSFNCSTSSSTLKLYVLDCGAIAFESPAPFGVEDSETDARQLAVPCYIVEHPRGRLLWNAGLPSELAGKGWVDPPPKTITAPGVQVRLDKTLVETLSELDLTMNSFDFVAFSHMHFDHVGTANDITGATFLTAQAEFDAAFADTVKVPLFNPIYYAALADAERLSVQDDHDVFGDGRVRIIAAPGHTPGHQVLLVDLVEEGPVLLSGDLYFFPISHELHRVPLFNVDKEQTVVSMKRVDSLLKETGASLWIEHDSAMFERIRKAPEFYQ